MLEMMFTVRLISLLSLWCNAQKEMYNNIQLPTTAFLISDRSVNICTSKPWFLWGELISSENDLAGSWIGYQSCCGFKSEMSAREKEWKSGGRNTFYIVIDPLTKQAGLLS